MFKLSSGGKFVNMWEEFSMDIGINLESMNYQARINNCIKTFSPISLKQSILLNENLLISHFERNSMDIYAAEETKEITKALKSESFFNLTNCKINQKSILLKPNTIPP